MSSRTPATSTTPCIRSLVLLPALVMFCCLPTLAATVYRSVDENGVVSFSDVMPDSGVAVDTLEMQITEPQLSANEQQRLEDIRVTTDRMAADRMARESHREVLRKTRAETESLLNPPVAVLPEPSPQYYEAFHYPPYQHRRYGQHRQPGYLTPYPGPVPGHIHRPPIVAVPERESFSVSFMPRR